MKRFTSQAIYLGLHPALIIATLLLIQFSPDPALTVGIAFLSSQLLLRLIERWFPAHPDWQQSWSDIGGVVLISIISVVFSGIAEGLFDTVLGPVFAGFRGWAGVLWPVGWPFLAQVLLAFALSELVFYWIHRSIHNSDLLWRISGHGCHHSFHNLHAINFLTAHPMEMFFLAVPQLVVGAMLGADSAVLLSSLALVIVNAGIAHGNVEVNSASTGGILTCGRDHRRHHSQILAESNSNYSCNLILLDKLFGTFTIGPVSQTGIGPTEPGLLGKLLINFREPADTQTAPRKQS